MNKCILIGNLTRDPELRTTTSTGVSVCSFTIAISRRNARNANNNGENARQDADFIPIVTWRELAENCAKYLRKGSQVAVYGSIQTRTYDAQDGTRRYVTEVVASEVKFLNRIAGREDQENYGGQNRSYNAPVQPQNAAANMDMEEIDEDLPF